MHKHQPDLVKKKYKYLFAKKHQPDLILLPIEGLPGPAGHQHGGDALLDLQQVLHPSAGCSAASKPGMGLE